MSLSESLLVAFDIIWQFLSIFLSLWWVYLPFFLAIIFYNVWQDYVIEQYVTKNLEWVTYEVALQPTVEKSQRAMEQVITSFMGAMKSPKLWEKVWEGQVPNKLSLEIVGKGGDVHLIIRTLRSTSNLVKSAVYSQFPDVELFEVEDYSKKYKPEDIESTHDLWGADFILSRDDVYPLRTYPDFSQQEAPGVEIDPLAQITEGLSTLRTGEEIWIQIPIVPVPAKSFTAKAEKEIQSILSKQNAEDENGYPAVQRLTPGELEQIRGVQHKMSKAVFLSLLRFVYIAEKDKFNKAQMGSVLGGFDQFGDNTLNSFKKDGSTVTSIDLWRRQTLVRRYRKRFMLEQYQSRSITNHAFHLNAEELTTLFHFPGEAVTTETLKRVQSKKASPPSGLPTGE